MPGSSKERASVRSGRVAPAMQLVNWPLRDDGIRAWLMALLLVALALLAGQRAGNAALGAVVFAALALAAWRLWMPVTFELGPKGVVQTLVRRQRRIPWAEFACFQPRRRGVLLFCDAEPSPLASLRGLYIRCSNEPERQQLLETIEFYLGGHALAQAPTKTPSH